VVTGARARGQTRVRMGGFDMALWRVEGGGTRIFKIDDVHRHATEGGTLLDSLRELCARVQANRPRHEAAERAALLLGAEAGWAGGGSGDAGGASGWARGVCATIIFCR
jgi:hypothetical protein